MKDKRAKLWAVFLIVATGLLISIPILYGKKTKGENQLATDDETSTKETAFQTTRKEDSTIFYTRGGR